MTPRLALGVAALPSCFSRPPTPPATATASPIRRSTCPPSRSRPTRSLFPRDRDVLRAADAAVVRRRSAGLARWRRPEACPSSSRCSTCSRSLLLFAAAVTFARPLGWDAMDDGDVSAAADAAPSDREDRRQHARGLHASAHAGVRARPARARVARSDARFAAAVLIVACRRCHSPDDGGWFAIVVVIAAWWPHRRSRAWLAAGAAGLLAAAVIGRLLLGSGLGSRARPDGQHVADACSATRTTSSRAGGRSMRGSSTSRIRSSSSLIYRRRMRRRIAPAGEGAVVAGLVTLVAVFLVSVPFTAMHIALAVQLQVNRVFWVLDTVALGYVAWFAIDVVARRWPRRAHGRGGARRDARAGARRICRARPAVRHDRACRERRGRTRWRGSRAGRPRGTCSPIPSHAWRYGSSVRVAASKDTLLDASKDPAFAIYSRDVALRVADATAALANFDTMTDADVRALGVAIPPRRVRRSRRPDVQSSRPFQE